jgi:hypothetical protein
MAVGIFLTALDGTIVVSCEVHSRCNRDRSHHDAAYAAIGNDLKELQKTSWIATSYLLTLTSFQYVPASSLSNPRYFLTRRIGRSTESSVTSLAGRVAFYSPIPCLLLGA